MDDLRLEQADDRLRQGVVVRIAATADRRFDPRVRESLGVPNRQILHAAVVMTDQRAVDVAIVQRLLQASSAKSLRSEALVRQPTMRREKTSITKAT